MVLKCFNRFETQENASNSAMDIVNDREHFEDFQLNFCFVPDFIDKCKQIVICLLFRDVERSTIYEFIKNNVHNIKHDGNVRITYIIYIKPNNI